jgi:TRAP-type C4-dicarboxylate transport system permease small subunit
MKDIITRLAATSNLPPVTPVGDEQNNLVEVVTNIINVVIGVLGIVAVIVIIMGGVSYMTSSGDAAKVKKAKDTILYGVIGLVVCVLAFAIVNFVIINVLQNS